MKDICFTPICVREASTMDTLITYDEVVALVANPPTLAPRPNFTNLRALLHRHLQRTLQHLVNPQSYVLGWTLSPSTSPMARLRTPCIYATSASRVS